MAKISYDGIVRLKELFRDVKMETPETVDMWDIDYARDVAFMLQNFEELYEIDPLKDRTLLHKVLSGLGVYEPLDMVKNFK